MRVLQTSKEWSKAFFLRTAGAVFRRYMSDPTIKAKPLQDPIKAWLEINGIDEERDLGPRALVDGVHVLCGGKVNSKFILSLCVRECVYVW